MGFFVYKLCVLFKSFTVKVENFTGNGGLICNFSEV